MECTNLETPTLFLESATFRMQNLKKLGDAAIAQIDDAGLHFMPGEETNSIAVNVKHLHGNMVSRWTDFLTTDGDKPWRDRDGEFVEDPSLRREQILKMWEEGWACLFAAFESLQPEDAGREVSIRGAKLSVIDAIDRQLTHVAYHVGQIVLTARIVRGKQWKPLSIPRGQSKKYVPRERD